MRTCSVCGKKYFRRNLFEGWVSQNPGKRVGWQKETLKVCLDCMNASQSRATLLRVAKVRFVGRKRGG